MKILLVLDQFDGANNGNTMAGRNLAQRLKERGHEVRVLAGGESRENEKWGLAVYHVPIFNNLVTRQGFAFAKPDMDKIREAVGWADFIHVLMPFFISKKAIMVAREMGKPFTGAFHVPPECITYSINMGKWKLVNDFLYMLERDYIFRYIPHIHCPSKMIADFLVKHRFKSQLHIISNGITDEFFQGSKLEKTDEFKGRFLVVMSGRMSHEKRQDVLIKAVRLSRHSKEIQLLLAGQGPLTEKYLRMGRDLPNPIMIRFYRRDELRDMLHMADLYVHASDAEIEAISAMEAIATGLVPVISDSKSSATGQFALDDRSLFKAGSPRSLAQKIDYWIEHPQQRLEMEPRYIEKANEYRISRCIDQMLDMFSLEIEENRKRLSK